MRVWCCWCCRCCWNSKLESGVTGVGVAGACYWNSKCESGVAGVGVAGVVGIASASLVLLVLMLHLLLE